MKVWLRLAPWIVMLVAWAGAATSAMSSEPRPTDPPLRITVVYNNVPHAPGLATAWGFAAVIEAGEERVLFDTGGDGPTLLANLERLDIDPASIDAVVLSHVHSDHTGGLDAFLERRPEVTVFLPSSFPAELRRSVERHGARVETVSGPRRLIGNLYSTGELGDGTREQALIADTAEGLVVVTGCAHPGIVSVAEAARSYLGEEIHLLTGGFHLRGESERSLRRTVRELKDLGVSKVAPSHCTGAEAIALFRRAWGEDFVEGGCGAVIEVP